MRHHPEEKKKNNKKENAVLVLLNFSLSGLVIVHRASLLPLKHIILFFDQCCLKAIFFIKPI